MEKSHFKSLDVVLFQTELASVSPVTFPNSFSLWNSFAVGVLAQPPTPTLFRDEIRLGKTDQGNPIGHRALFGYRPEPINTLPDMKTGQGHLMNAEHQSCVVLGPPSGSEGGGKRPVLLLSAILGPWRSWPFEDVPNREKVPWVTEKLDMQFGRALLEDLSLYLFVM